MGRLMRDKRRTGWVTRMALVATVAGVLTGCAETTPIPHPNFDGPVIEHQQGNFRHGPDVSLGVAQVWDGRAVIHVSNNNGEIEILALEVGEAGEAYGQHLRLCGVWVDTDKSHNAPGSIESTAYYVVSTGDSAPECPAQIPPDD